MENCEPLIWYGTLVLLLTGSFILIPYLRCKGELLSAWSILLLGIAIFLGFGCFEAATSQIRSHGLQWFEPTKGEVDWFLAASTIFLVTLFISYYYDPVSRAVAARCLNKWPPISTRLILFVLFVCILMILAAPVAAGTPFFGMALAKLSQKAIVFACVFSFVLWYRNKLNIAWLGVFIVVFAAMSFLAMLAGGGRRLILSVFVGPILVIYYIYVRNWRPTRGMVAVALATLAMFTVGLMYSSIRHFDRGAGKRARTAENLAEEVGKIGEKDWMSGFAKRRLFFLSQQAVHYSLITDRFITMGFLEPKPLNTLSFLISYPIPRKIWAEKPKPLGGTIGEEVIPHYARSRGVRWGCGVAGQARYEGGLLVAALYAYLAVFGVRLIDDPLIRQPHNPFLISILATASPHILGWPRGDLGIMSMETMQAFLFAIILGIIGRILFGTASVPSDSRQVSNVSYRRLASSRYPAR